MTIGLTFQQSSEKKMQESKGTVLVADDSTLSLRWVRGCLTWEGYDVLTAHDGEEALTMAATKNTDIMLLDAVMPRLNGKEVAQVLEKSSERPRPPVVLMTPPGYVTDMHGVDWVLEKPVKRGEVLSVVQNILDQKRALKNYVPMSNVVNSFGRALEVWDGETGRHCTQVGEYAHNLADRLGLPEKQCESIRDAAILHDLGKLGTNHSILFKPFGLSAEEYREVQKHPSLADWVLEQIVRDPTLRETVLYHHERWDGSGYPEGLQGENIPLGARILAVVDVYDALQANRPYHSPLTRKQARSAIKWDRGVKYDPRIVDAFLGMLNQR